MQLCQYSLFYKHTTNSYEEVFTNLGYGATGGTSLGLADILKALSETSAKPKFHSSGLNLLEEFRTGF